MVRNEIPNGYLCSALTYLTYYMRPLTYTRYLSPRSSSSPPPSSSRLRPLVARDSDFRLFPVATSAGAREAVALLPGRQEQRVFEHQGHPSALVRRRIFGRQHRVLVDVLTIIKHLNDITVK